jgi:sulfur transfer complex TusBCD TusB component (DsrH family)
MNTAYTNSLLKDGHAENYEPREFVYQFGTVNINVGRQVGASTFIMRQATENDLILVPSDLVEEFYTESKALVVCSENLVLLKKDIEARAFEKIYVDSPAFCHPLITGMALELIKKHTQQIIMFGMH